MNRSLLTISVLSLSLTCAAQITKTDTAFIASAQAYQKGLYEQFIHGQSRLYNGSEHKDYLSREEEHPYFFMDDWAYGVLIYDDERYENVPMFYDLSRDKVISEHILNGAKIELVPEKISMFTVSGHTFVRLLSDTSKIISSGFYDMLYDGGSKVFVKREKILQERVESSRIIALFEEKNKIYVYKDGVYHTVRKKKSVLAVFGDKKQELRSFLNKNNIKFRLDREHAIVRMAQFYDDQTSNL